MNMNQITPNSFGGVNDSLWASTNLSEYMRLATIRHKDDDADEQWCSQYSTCMQAKVQLTVDNLSERMLDYRIHVLECHDFVIYLLLDDMLKAHSCIYSIQYETLGNHIKCKTW